MTEIDEIEITMIAREITEYLAGHPHAADTLGGITRWWLARQRYEQAVDLVQKALDYLVIQGVVNTTAMPGGSVVYSRWSRLADREESQ